jgi:hypothetical protein
MMMTTSSSDGEALVALRKANSFLSANNTNWKDFINATPIPRPPPRPSGRGFEYMRSQSDFTDPEIPRMLDSLLRDTKGEFRAVLESWKQYWEDHGHLTERQYSALINCYERAK